jgi:hypothetical protein
MRTCTICERRARRKHAIDCARKLRCSKNLKEKEAPTLKIPNLENHTLHSICLCVVVNV